VTGAKSVNGLFMPKRTQYNDPGSRALTSTETWEVFFSIRAAASEADNVVASFTEIADGSSAAFESALISAFNEVVEDFDANALAFTGFTELPADLEAQGSVVLNQVAEVEYEEVQLVIFLLQNTENITAANRTLGNFTVVGIVITEVSVEADGGSTIIEVGDGLTAEVPESLFEALGVANITQEVVVVASGQVSQTNVAVGDLIISNDGQTEVRTLLNLNFFSQDQGVYSVSGLLEPIILTLPVDDARAICVWWDTSINDWSEEGITLLNFTGTHLVCATTHLTLFAAIIRGIVDTIECSQVTLLTSEGIRAIGEPEWAGRGLTWILWGLLIFLVSFLLYAVWLDTHRERNNIWSDQHLLVPEQQDAEGGEGGSFPRATCLAMCEVMSIAFREVLDDFCGEFFEYFAEVRDLCEAMREGLADALAFSRAGGGEGGYGFGTVVLIMLAKQSLHKTAHINACQRVGVHPGDDFDYAVAALDPTIPQEELAERQGTRKSFSRSSTRFSRASTRRKSGASMSRASSKNSKASRRSEKSRGTSGGASSDPDDETFDTSPRTAGKEVRISMPEKIPNPKQGSDENLPSDAGPLTGTSSKGLSLMQVSKSLGLGSRSRADTMNMDVDPNKTVNNLREGYSTRFEREHMRFKNSCWKTMVSMVRPWLHHNPIGDALIFSISVPSGIRALFIVCDLAGAFLITTLFMPSVNAAPSKRNVDSCEIPDVGGLIGRLIAIGLIAAFVAAFPVTMLARLHNRDFCRIDYPGGEQWNRRLQIWRARDRLLWVVGLLYAGFCFFYIMLFFANVKEGSHGPWLTSIFITVTNDLLIAPLALVIAAPILALVCIAILTWVLWLPRHEVVEMLAAFNLSEALAALGSPRHGTPRHGTPRAGETPSSAHAGFPGWNDGRSQDVEEPECEPNREVTEAEATDLIAALPVDEQEAQGAISVEMTPNEFIVSRSGRPAEVWSRRLTGASDIPEEGFSREYDTSRTSSPSPRAHRDAPAEVTHSFPTWL